MGARRVQHVCWLSSSFLPRARLVRARRDGLIEIAVSNKCAYIWEKKLEY